MSWPDQVVGLKNIGEPQRSETATRLVDAWLRQPDVPREWHVGRNEKLTKKVRDRTIAVLLESADRPAREAQAKQEAKDARLAAAPKYTMFTPPPVDEHLARGGEVWARVAPAEQSLNGTGYRQFWLLSADRKTFVALVTVMQLDEKKPLGTEPWYVVDVIGDGLTKHFRADGTDESTMTTSVTVTTATLTTVIKSTNTGERGTFKSQNEIVATFDFPSDPGALSVFGEERRVDTFFLNGTSSGGPFRKSKQEQFHQIKKPNPPSGAGKGK
jgi:hypothetical protein